MHRRAPASCGLLATVLSVAGLPANARGGSDDRIARESFDRGADLESRAAGLLKAGDKKAAEDTLEQALRAYRSALRHAPADPDPALRIGTILLFKERCDQALPMLRRSAKLAFGVDLTPSETVASNALGARPKLRKLLLLLGQCRLAEGPDPFGFKVLEAVQDLGPSVHFLVGRRYLEGDQLKPALTHLSEYLRHEPEDHKTRHAVANLQLRLDRLAEAAASYRTILSHHPNDLAALKNLAVVQVKQSQYAPAIRTLERVLDHTPNDVAARFNLGVCLSRVDDHAAAVKQFRKALRLKPKLSRAWHKLGLSLSVLEREEDARDAFERAIRHAPRHAPSYLALARSHRSAGALADCASVLERGLRHEPREPRMLLDRGDCLRDLGKPSDALDVHLAGAQAAPHDAALQAALGADYRALGRLEEAVLPYRRALELDAELDATVRPALGDVLGRLGTQALRRNELDGAVSSLEEAVSLRPSDAVDLANYGLALLSTGRTPKAEETLLKAHALRPEDSAIGTALARVQLATGKVDEAIRTLRRPVKERAPTAARFDRLYLLGLAYLHAGQVEPAADHLQAALELKPNDAPVRFALGRALIRGRRYQTAWTVLAAPPAADPPDADSPAADQPDVERGAFRLARGYAAYRARDYESATRILEADDKDRVPAFAIRTAAWMHLGQELARRRQLRGALSAFRTAEALDASTAAKANAASMEYRLGQPQRAYEIWKSLTGRRAPAELYYNMAIYQDDKLGNESAAYTWYRKYARKLPAQKREEALAVVARKRALFGFEP